MDILRSLGLVERIGRPGDPYLDRYFLTPMTPWGQLLLHRFHRGDMDDDPHDHRWNFWTWPLEDYVELVMDKSTGLLSPHIVRGRRWSFRRWDHTHIVLGPVSRLWASMTVLKSWCRDQERVLSTPKEELPVSCAPGPSCFVVRAPFYTLVWRTPQLRRSWGFWPRHPGEGSGEPHWSTLWAGRRCWMEWSEYLRRRSQGDLP